MLALIVGGMAAAMFASHRPGHWWGDDWALYIRQAKGVLDGHPGRVLDENRFTVEASEGSAFSPPLYPWGFPLLLAPFVSIVGDDLDRLAIVPVLCACLFACSWYALAKPRIGTFAAMLGVVAVTLTPVLLSWTELIQSEWPFLAITALTLVGVDRVVTSGGLVKPTAGWAPLALVGLGAAFAFTVRREGLALFAAVLAAQLVALADLEQRPWSLPRRKLRHLLGRLAVPHTIGLGFVALLQLILPSTLVPQYAGTGVGNVWRLRAKLFRNLAEISGFKRPTAPDPTVLGSVGLGWSVLVVYLVVGYFGVVVASTTGRRRDVHLAAYVVVAIVIGGSFRVAINRYVCTVAPLLLLLALSLTVIAIRAVHRPRLAGSVASVVLALIATGNLVQARTAIENAQAFTDAGQVEWGPTHPDAVEMFEAVKHLTKPDDVVAAPKARAMVLETDRRSIQVDEYHPIPPDLTIALIVADRDSSVAIHLNAMPDKYRLIWENLRFQIFVPTRSGE